MRFRKLFLLVSAATLCLGASEGTPDAREAFGEAMDHRANGDVRAARIELMNAIKEDPQWIDARVAQAEVLLDLFDGIGAQAELDQAFDLGLDPALVRHLYGHALQMQGKLQKARDQLMADDIPQQHLPYAARILGATARGLGDDLLASQSYDRAIQLDPKNSMLWVDIARYRAGSGDQAGAIAAVDEAVKLDAANIRALQYRGELLRTQFGLGAALPWFERALQIDPNDVALLTEYAATLGDMGRMKEMLIVARKIIALDGKNPRAFYMQAVLAARAGKYDLARTLMQRTEGRMDGAPAVIMMTGVIEFNEGNYNAAIEKFRKLASMQPQNVKAQNLLARALYMAGDAETTVEVLKPQVNQSGAEPYALWLVARALEALDAREEAIGVLNRAARHDAGQAASFEQETSVDILRAEAGRSPGNAQVVIPYIRALYNSGNTAGAFDQARRLQAANPGASDAHILVADTALGSGNYDAALDALDRARRIKFSEPVLLRMIEALRAKGDYQQSGIMLAQFLQYNPNNVAALRWMAYAHLETGNWAVAQRILEGLRLRIGENDALVMAGLAQAYTGLGDIKRAIAAGRIAYRVQPSSPVVSHLYGLAVLADGGRNKDAVDLIEKAVEIAPEVALYQQSLKQAYAALKAEKNTAKT